MGCAPLGGLAQQGGDDLGAGSVTLGLTYIYIELDGSPKFELDKLNSVFKVNGVDLLAKVRKYT